MSDQIKVIEDRVYVSVDETRIEVVSVGSPGINGVGVPAGGTTGQVLTKTASGDFYTAWANTAASVNGKVGTVLLNQDEIPDGTTAKQYSQVEKTKLATISSGATQNASDNALRDRTTHTGVQPIATVTGLQTALDAKSSNAALTAHTSNVSNPHAVTKAQVGLDNVDNTSDLAKPVSSATQTALDTKQPTGDYATNTALTSGLSGKANTAHTHAQADVTNLTTDLALKAPLASPTFTGTPTGITKAHVGLPLADNTADTAKPVSTAQQTALDGKRDILSTPTRLYATDGAGAQIAYQYAYSATPNSVPSRNVSGLFQVGTPTVSAEVANKGYVDTADALKLNITDNRVIRQGTGFPNGVVTANVGSIYIDTAFTNGASSWIKKSGTGNTGFEILEGDTKWREISTLAPVGNITSGSLQIRRIGSRIFIQASNLYIPSTSNTPLIADIGVSLGSSFRPIENNSAIISASVASGVTKMLSIAPLSTTNGITHSGEISTRYWAASYDTAQPWPSTLPGTAA
ncbi:hypothetical protein E3O62_02495 [Cryobacterium sp. TMT2-15-1]|uniref:hypothetical protein n=1 Tax=Cryobacterium sp. TMT2-15-1 TaxID=1259246 RepID=UPI0010696977|nr:hypothetical protein [Cryobacterium sp. TMT2-15-1]TFC63716.1 hypothetical protein E3O62_02495 [Cryobacterium sp. TMT2-15-1]